MYYDPKTNRYPYPESTDAHYLHVKKNNGLVFDENYPYIDKSKSFLFKQKMTRILLYLIVFPLTRLRFGLKIKGKENLKKYKAVLDKGVVSVCNHVHMWDYLGIMSAVRPRKTYILAWAPNIRGENASMLRSVGAIPVPDGNMKGTFAYFDAIKNHLQNGGWLHIYSEGSMWEYYAPIRPFKKGAAYFAVDNNRPILPLAYSYRKASWWRRKIMKQIAVFTLNIGEPIFLNKELPKSQQELDLTIRSHDAVCRLAGIDPKENVYGPVFDKSKRVDYYTNEYGVGYRGSW